MNEPVRRADADVQAVIGDVDILLLQTGHRAGVGLGGRCDRLTCCRVEYSDSRPLCRSRRVDCTLASVADPNSELSTSTANLV
jgi:hypothetical protein